MDRRQKKTREAIFQAFGSLLSKKSYSRVTVQEIIDRANVGRSTFYAHFETKDDLLRELCSDLFGHVFSPVLMSEKTHDFSQAAENPENIITHILYHLKDNEKNIIGILNGESGNIFLQFFRPYVNELVKSRILGNRKPGIRNLPDDFLLNHISGSFMNMIQWWIRNGLKRPPEEMTSFFEAVVAPVIGVNNPN